MSLGDNAPKKSQAKQYYRAGNNNADEAINRNKSFKKEHGIYQEYAPYYLKALCEFGLKRYKEAKDAIGVAIDQNNGNRAYFELLANICANRKEWEEAGNARMTAAEFSLAEGLLDNAQANYKKAKKNYNNAKNSSETEEARLKFDQKANEAESQITEVQKPQKP